MLAELPRAIYSPVTAGTYGVISCHSLILLALRPFQHFTHTDRGKLIKSKILSEVASMMHGQIIENQINF